MTTKERQCSSIKYILSRYDIGNGKSHQCVQCKNTRLAWCEKPRQGSKNGLFPLEVLNAFLVPPKLHIFGELIK